LAPVRHSSPWGRLGGVIPFGEGLGVRLFVELKKSFGGIHPLLSEGLGEAVCLHFDYAF